MFKDNYLDVPILSFHNNTCIFEIKFLHKFYQSYSKKKKREEIISVLCTNAWVGKLKTKLNLVKLS